MKTKNNVQKTITKSVALLISLVLLSFTLNAQGSLNNLLADNSFGTIAKVLVGSSSDNTDSNAWAEIMQTDNEPTLSLEEWMLENPNYSATGFGYEEESDVPLEIEEWMVNDVFSTNFATDEEAPLTVQSWMLNNRL